MKKDISLLPHLDFLLNDATNLGCERELIGAGDHSDETSADRFVSCVLSSLDDGAAKCLPKNALEQPQHETDKRIRDCFQNDQDTKKAKAAYEELITFIGSNGSAAKIFAKHLRKGARLTEEISDVHQYNVDRVNEAAAKQCFAESREIYNSVNETLPIEHQVTALNKWNTCMYMSLCKQSVQTCLSKMKRIEDNPQVWNQSSVVDALDCLDDDAQVSKCTSYYHDIMKKEQANTL
ncbi:hypothetical protein AKO1_008032 [Acrasis kona]|uniref:Secreted protein n=1 Tax=Acrasis kona TaxID=1008807 RepID=A0AAW2YP12_9EUKA